MYFNNLKNKIINNKVKIGIIGLGYVGLPLSIKFTQKNISVVGFDIDKKLVSTLNNGKFHLKTINKIFMNNKFKKNFSATTNFSKISDVDVIIICVPTPLKKDKKPDLSFLKNTIKNIEKYLVHGQLISLESTTYPGTTRELIVNKISNKYQIGKDFFISFSPERENPGENSILFNKITKICGGFSKKCRELSKNLYLKISPVKTVSSLEAAEMTKLHENIYRTVNISLVNEMKMISEKFGLDINEIINAAKTKPFGFNAFYPGPGIGGHCIPVDPFYLVWAAKKRNVRTDFIDLSARINERISTWMLKIIKKTLKTSNKSKKKILAVGLSYKKNVDDTRESPSFKIIEKLLKANFIVKYYDPFFKKFPKQRNYKFNIKTIKFNKTNISKFDAVIILTNHDKINYELIEENAKFIFDTRGVIKKNDNVKYV